MLKTFSVEEITDGLGGGKIRVRAQYEVKARSRDEAIRKVANVVGRRSFRAIEVTAERLFLGWLCSVSERMLLALNI
ncbi:MAG: hypothetical protein FJZ01_11215 [Candidatus Sericytochromatia bacterium]|nr:hypothetical protein [Candidatus Tanganyikabacteria bacterium]